MKRRESSEWPGELGGQWLVTTVVERARRD